VDPAVPTEPVELPLPPPPPAAAPAGVASPPSVAATQPATGPGAAGPHDANPARPSRRWVPAVAGIAGFIAIALIAFAVVLITQGGDDKKAPESATVVTHRPSSSTRRTTPTTEPDVSTTVATSDLRGVVTQLDTMLDTSEATRTRLNQTIIQPFQSCTVSAADAVTQIGEVINDRKTLQATVDRLESSTTDATARSLLTQLSQALGYSISSNQLYESWFQANVGAGACSTALGADSRSQGDALGTQASSAKAAFVAAYNPVAASFGLRARDATKI
jgi:hypothetical protein